MIVNLEPVFEEVSHEPEEMENVEDNEDENSGSKVKTVKKRGLTALRKATTVSTLSFTNCLRVKIIDSVLVVVSM